MNATAIHNPNRPAGCICRHYSDGDVYRDRCPLHAATDPCGEMARTTGKRREGTIIGGVCTNCGHGAPTPVCCCYTHNDGSVSRDLCPMHAETDPCANRACLRGKRRQGAIRGGVCTTCGHSARRAAEARAAQEAAAQETADGGSFISIFDEDDAQETADDQETTETAAEAAPETADGGSFISIFDEDDAQETADDQALAPRPLHWYSSSNAPGTGPAAGQGEEG